MYGKKKKVTIDVLLRPLIIAEYGGCNCRIIVVARLKPKELEQCYSNEV